MELPKKPPRKLPMNGGPKLLCQNVIFPLLTVVYAAQLFKLVLRLTRHKVSLFTYYFLNCHNSLNNTFIFVTKVFSYVILRMYLHIKEVL